MTFNEVANSIIISLSNIYHSKYVSVSLFQDEHIKNIKSNVFNGYHDIMYDGELINDCLLYKITQNIYKAPIEKENVIVWSNVSGLYDYVHKMKVEQGLHHGISVTFKKNNNIAWCVSACCDETQGKEIFHSRFKSKTKIIKEITQAYNPQ